MSSRIGIGLTLTALTVIAVVLFYLSGTDIVQSLSPQGCRMSWMSPSYILQSQFDTHWSPFANRYSLWLYREVGWENNQLHGSPVLFIPGNAGSSHQVRSIASSAARQYYSEPYKVAQEFKSTPHKPLDIFAVEFNEDLSAFHGPTLGSETAYTSRAIDYILSLYTEPTSILVLGHSMGGIVATTLLPHPNISAIITMSTPHTLPPARFDSRVDSIYAAGLDRLATDTTPILSLCGGATDLMIPSESCILPAPSGEVYRRTVFSSALEGSWTGVGHREMVWCHQVRWRVARAALDIAAARSLQERAFALDKWLRDGHTLPPGLPASDGARVVPSQDHETLPVGLHLVVKQPRGSRTYSLPVPPSETDAKFILYVSRGSIAPIAPHHPSSLSVSVSLCRGSTDCSPLAPTVLKLIPNPIPGQPFPLPGEGTDESEGVVVFEAVVPATRGDDTAVVVQIDGANGDKHGWVVGGWAEKTSVKNDISTAGLLWTPSVIPLPHEHNLQVDIDLPNLLSSSLVVYRLVPTFDNPQSCADALLPPLLQHTSHPSETHYFPLSPSPSRAPILLHSHASGPFVPRPAPPRGPALAVYASGACAPAALVLRVDWWGSLGRWGSRYAPAAVGWAVGVAALVAFDAWREFDASDAVPAISVVLGRFSSNTLPWLLLSSFALSFVPLPVSYWLGNGGEPLFAPLAPLLLTISTGLVWIVWWLVSGSLYVFSRVLALFGRHRKGDDRILRRRALLSLVLICLLIFVLIPWQVAFLGSWVFHFYTCAAELAASPSPSTPASPGAPSGSIPLVQRASTSSDTDKDANDRAALSARKAIADVYRLYTYLLFLMTWLLPFAAPVLAVWVRTMASAGVTAPFDGDHNFLRVLPFLVLTEMAGVVSGRSGRAMVRNSSTRWMVLAIAVCAFLVGARTTYLVLDVASVVAGIVAAVHVVPLYWTGN